MINVKVETAVELNASQRDKLTGVLTQQLGQEIQLVNQVNPQIIGGMRIVTPQKTIDLTLAAKLNQLYTQLLKQV